jgi:hypothetical protein
MSDHRLPAAIPERLSCTLQLFKTRREYIPVVSRPASLLVTVLKGCRVQLSSSIERNSDYLLDCTAIVQIVSVIALEISQGPLMDL